MTNLNKASVLVLIEETSNSILLTKRSQHLRHHPGEVCFPGGMYELTDNTLYETALRELEEELAINHERVKLIKPLKIESTLGGISIQPWFATIPQITPYKANLEVVEVILIDVNTIYDLNNYKKIKVKRNTMEVYSMQFFYKDYFIWGVTARILYQLAHCNKLMS